MSVPTDCPQRDERKGWMGDAALTVDEALFNFKLPAFYQNWAQNIRDSQLPNGAVGDTTPLTFGGIPADPAWGTAYPTTVYSLYDHYGDFATALDHYKNLQAWVDFLGGEVAKTGFGMMYYHYGDWVPPPPWPSTNESLTSSAAYAIDVLNLGKLAGVLGNTGDQQKYTALFNEIGSQFHAAFYNSSIKSYVGGTLTGNVLAMAINAVPPTLQPTILNNIIQIIHNAGNHSTCGILGARWLYPILSDNGHHDLALQIATSITYPSLGYSFNNPFENATTLWEILDAPFEGPGMNSRNHIMFGSIGSWFYRYIGGIRPNGLEQIEIRPYPVGPNSPVTRANVSYDSIKGVIGVNWLKTEEYFNMDVAVPSATTALVTIPHHDLAYCNLKVNGEIIADFSGEEPLFHSVLGVDPVGLQEDGSILLNVQPGKYSFFASVQ
jgi:alpha-L-rhamnosidase